MSPDHVGWCKASAWALGEVLAGLPRPMSRAAMVLDLDFMVDRRKMTGEPVPGVRLLSRRWGVGVKAARLAVEAWRRDSLVGRAEVEGHGEGHAQGHGEGHGEGHALSATMPMDSASLAQEGHAQGHGEGHGEGHAQGTPLVQEVLFTGIVEAPQTTDIQTSDKNTSKPAKAGGGAEEVCADLLKAMHAIALEHDPKARLQRVTTHETRIARTLKGVAKEAKAAGKAPAELILDGWRWWWANPRDFLRVKYPGAEAYPVVIQADKVLKYAAAWAEVEAARYIPTADEALDAVLEVGCAEAEARYPAAARAIRQTFDFEMGGNLARMRAPKDPDRMRAAWSAGYAKYLTPKLALVAR